MVEQLKDPVVDVLIPARNAAATVGAVIDEIPSRWVRSVVVVDGDSRDATAQVAQDRGAIVVRGRDRGYGLVCRRGVQHLESLPEPPDVVVFLAADGSDDPAQLPALLQPMQEDNAELVVGVRHEGRGSMAKVSVRLISALYGYRFEDLGPYRAIRFPALVALGLRDGGDGWNTEMQVKALKLGLQIAQVQVSTRRVGRSRSLSRTASKAGRTLFQIIRHSTSR